EADVTDGSRDLQSGAVGLWEGVAGLAGEVGGLHGADADERHGEPRPARDDVGHRGVRHERLTSRSGAQHSRGGQQHRLGTRDVGELTDEAGRLHLDTGVAYAADELSDGVDHRGAERAHGADDGDQRGGPRGDADRVTADEGRREVVRGGRPDRRRDVLVPSPASTTTAWRSLNTCSSRSSTSVWTPGGSATVVRTMPISVARLSMRDTRGWEMCKASAMADWRIPRS